MSSRLQDKLLDIVATATGLNTDPAAVARAEAESRYKQEQSDKALAVSRITRQGAYLGAGLAAFSILAVTVYLLRKTISAQQAEG
jgi:hypothetical protein